MTRAFLVADSMS